MSRHKTGKEKRARKVRVKRREQRARRRSRTARPICPECGSADVVVTAKTGKCNRCSEMFRAEAATAYPKGSGEQSASTNTRRALTDEPADDWLEASIRTAI